MSEFVSEKRHYQYLKKLYCFKASDVAYDSQDEDDYFQDTVLFFLENNIIVPDLKTANKIFDFKFCNKRFVARRTNARKREMHKQARVKLIEGMHDTLVDIELFELIDQFKHEGARLSD